VIHSTTTNQSQFPLFRLLLGSVCISFSPIFIKLAALPPDSAGFYRMLFAGLSLFVLLRLRGETLQMARRTQLLLCCAGIFLAMDFMCWHRSIELIGPGLSTLLANFQVFFTALFSWLLLKQKVSKLFILAIVLAIAGLFLITGIDWQELERGYKLGIFLALLTAVLYSGYILCLKTALSESSVSGVSAMLLLSIPSALLLAVITPLNGASFAIPSTQSFLALIGVGVLGTTVGWSFISSAIKYIPATVAGLVLLLQPTLAMIWDVLFFDRPTGGLEVVGVLLILSAIYIGSCRN